MDDILSSEFIALVFTDIVGSSRLSRDYGARYRYDKNEHDALILTLMQDHQGKKVKSTGDGFFLVFSNALDALHWAVETQICLLAKRWEMPEPIRVRMGLHYGAPERVIISNEPDDYQGPDVDLASRIMDQAKGGEIFASQEFYEETCGALTLPFAYRSRSSRMLKNIGERPLWQLNHRELPSRSDSPDIPEEIPVQPPPSNMKHLPNAHFYGRDAALDEIRAKLNSPHNPIVALCGMGGIGKTQLAAQYGHRHFNDYPGGVFWLDARNEQYLIQNYYDIAQYTVGVVRGGADEIARRVRAELQRCSKQTLLIFDNIVDPAMLEWLPAIGGCHRLLTSQLQNFRAGIEKYPVPCLQEDDSLSLLNVSVPIGDDSQEDEAARKIVRMVGNLPLAVAQLAHHIGELECSYVEYAQRLSADMPNMLERASRRFNTATDHEASIYATIELTASGLNTIDTLAMPILTTAACFAPNGVPSEVLRKACGIRDSHQFEDAVSVLKEKSLLMRERRDRTETERVTLHEMVRSYAQKSLSPARCKATVSRVCSALADRFAEANKAMDWTAAHNDLAHCFSAVKIASALKSPPEELVGILSEMTRFLVENRDYTNAQSYGMQGLSLSEKLYGKESQQYANFLRLQGEILQARGDAAGALASVKAAWQLIRPILSPNAVERADYTNSLGFVLKKQERYKCALHFYREALEIYEIQEVNQRTQWDALKAMVLNNLGATLESLGQYPEACRYFEQSLVLQRQLGNSSLLPILLNSIGRVLGSDQKWEEALELHKEARDFAMKIFQVFHPDICACHYYIGKALAGLGQRDEALTEYRTALKGYQKPANIKDCSYQINVVKACIAELNADEN